MVTVDFLLAAATVVSALLKADPDSGRFWRWRTREWVQRPATVSWSRYSTFTPAAVNDYVVWLVAGLAAMGTVLARG